MDVKELLVCSEEEEMRLDLFLCRHFPDKSRNHIQNIIERGQVHVNGKTKKEQL